MSDEITVRVTLDKSALLAPATRVYVQLPEVARAEYLLPADRFEGLKDRAWPAVLDEALEHAAQGWAKAAPSAAARLRIAEWLRMPGHRAEVQAAFEVDHARRHPVGRKLLAEIERLRARVAELEAERAALLAERHATNEVLDDVVQELRARRGAPVETVTVRPAGDVTPQVAKLRDLLAGQRAALEDPHDSPLHHDYQVPRDLPPLDGAR